MMVEDVSLPLAVSLIFLLLMGMGMRIGTAVSNSDADVLLSFKAALGDPSESLRSWAGTGSAGPCAAPGRPWRGVLCNGGGEVLGLQLEGMGLSGQLDLGALEPLPMLRTVSFSNNSFDGPMPAGLKKLGRLRQVYLSANRLSGRIPDDAFGGMLSLRKVELSNNGFSGPIPSSLLAGGATRLLEVRMADNELEGELPDFPAAMLSGLTVFDVSNNRLEGRIPEGLKNMDAAMFAGNSKLCGPPLTVQCKQATRREQTPGGSTARAPSSPDSKHGLPTSVKVAIAVTTVGVVLAAIGAAFAVLRRRKEEDGKGRLALALALSRSFSTTSVVVEHGGDVVGRKKTSAVAAVNEDKDEGSLTFFARDEVGRFELPDLLKASAQVLGGGELGSSYRATLLLSGGPSVVVAKRFKEMNRVGKEEFREHMRRIGRLSHPNLLPLLAYYCKEEEKLLVTDYIAHGSLASLLHGNRSRDAPSLLLDWPARLKIVKGVARGLSYLYEELSATMSTPHGHLKSSNVLLDENQEPLLTDYALGPTMNQARAAKAMIAYKSPEYKQFRRLSKKSDVWSFGVLILELLTGKFPGSFSRQGNGGGSSDLASWVNSVVREEWTAEVFDSEMRMTTNCEGGMLTLLQIGLGCCEADLNKRWEMKYAIEQVEGLKERDAEDDGDGYSYLSEEGEMYSRSVMSEDEFSLSMVK